MANDIFDTLLQNKQPFGGRDSTYKQGLNRFPVMTENRIPGEQALRNIQQMYPSVNVDYKDPRVQAQLAQLAGVTSPKALSALMSLLIPSTANAPEKSGYPADELTSAIMSTIANNSQNVPYETINEKVAGMLPNRGEPSMSPMERAEWEAALSGSQQEAKDASKPLVIPEETLTQRVGRMLPNRAEAPISFNPSAEAPSVRTPMGLDDLIKLYGPERLQTIGKPSPNTESSLITGLKEMSKSRVPEKQPIRPLPSLAELMSAKNNEKNEWTQALKGSQQEAKDINKNEWTQALSGTEKEKNDIDMKEFDLALKGSNQEVQDLKKKEVSQKPQPMKRTEDVKKDTYTPDPAINEALKKIVARSQDPNIGEIVKQAVAKTKQATGKDVYTTPEFNVPTSNVDTSAIVKQAADESKAKAQKELHDEMMRNRLMFGERGNL